MTPPKPQQNDPKLRAIELQMDKLEKMTPSSIRNDSMRSLSRMKDMRIYELEAERLASDFPGMRVAGQRPEQVFVITWGDEVNCRVVDLKNRTAYPKAKLKTVLARGGWQKPHTTLKAQQIAALVDWNAHRVPGRY